MQAEPLLDWADVGRQLLSFLAVFATAGAVGFRYSALRTRFAAAAPAEEPDIYRDAARRAAWIGAVGAVIRAVLFVVGLQDTAARRGVTVGEAFGAGGVGQVLQVVALALLVGGFLLALRRVNAGWMLAAVGLALSALRGLATGNWASIVNPVHMLAAGMWIGTLAVLVFVGIATTYAHGVTGERRGRVVADMVNAFSPLALGSALVLVTFGVITAVRHLKYWAALWTTPYGQMFLVKLALVATVVALGAWNWRRVRPTLGEDAGASAIRRSARMELAVAALVLLATAVVVSLPTPKLPGS
jgi:copper transport protein